MAVDVADLPVVVSLSPCQKVHALRPNMYQLNLFLIDWSVLLLMNKFELNSALLLSEVSVLAIQMVYRHQDGVWCVTILIPPFFSNSVPEAMTSLLKLYVVIIIEFLPFSKFFVNF